jgi:hypothetical protein
MSEPDEGRMPTPLGWPGDPLAHRPSSDGRPSPLGWPGWTRAGATRAVTVNASPDAPTTVPPQAAPESEDVRMVDEPQDGPAGAGAVITESDAAANGGVVTDASHRRIREVLDAATV